MVSEVSQMEKGKYFMVSFVNGILKKQNRESLTKEQNTKYGYVGEISNSF